ncbi:glycosyltransferase family protein [Rhizobium sp. S95]|uniref:Glycosyltransferase family protein n=1 Tax=Ciceribacter sichuanensis TaxID=2949647 RepID=A0AAJ1F9C7_9HYPH|nr:MULTISPECIES: glycosyltransferase family protein [unclassified Ciceribacter]MCM2397347.1 glycosyltransferase family protein [Ciceribacter sp. S95]MCO5959003.1 glycosyltransferase family protein [Ciceribacter sp. S101]
MTGQSRKARILMYSHDTFGLGHLRRCRTIAHSLVEDYRGLQVLIISGATIAGAFDYRARVDFMKIPSVIKLRNGEYTSMDQHIDVKATIRMRQSIILHTAETFQPDIFIIDKEPLGLRGEVEETLRFLKARGTTLILGLREVMDAPHLLDAEWKRNDVLHKIGSLYDNIWVYGPPDFYDPLTGLDVPDSIREKMNFVGFLQRKASVERPQPPEDYLLVTTGGGGDGADLVRDVIAAYQADPTLTHKAVIVLGPYMPAEQRQNFVEQAGNNPHLEMIEFDNRMEDRIAGAKAVVAMGGYNTYCEILSFDKPALIVPRTQPRLEQLIRARRASELGLVSMLSGQEASDSLRFAQAIKDVLKRDPPSASAAGLHLEGLQTISQIVGGYLNEDARSPRFAAQG